MNDHHAENGQSISCEVHNLSVGHLDNICYGLAYYGFNASANDSKC